MFFLCFLLTAQSWEKQIINGEKKIITNITKYSNFNTLAMSYQGHNMQKKHWIVLSKESLLEKALQVTKW